ncbi:MAG: right-handed parallel beta-helix repeat-containing protein, partial [Deltaproteobacteria bacterium]|nr:right-handed parallel beta-helix repeat-containing protein [Deltaproteobacteria bacterium]
MRGVLLLLLLTGCRQLLGFENPIAGTPDDALVDAPIGCEVSNACPANAPICLDEICVECTEASSTQCAGSTPVCGQDNHCRGCATHAECDSEVCLSDGSCADPASVAYVNPNGAGAACELALPCATVPLGVATGRPLLKVSGTVVSMNVVAIDRAIEIHADPGAVLTRASAGPIIDITNPGNVTIYDLVIRDATGGGAGIKLERGSLRIERVRLLRNDGHGLEARNESTVTVRRCIVSGNRGGGLNIENSTFEVTNTLIVRNGTLGSSSGGARLKPAGASVFELNTIADNVSLNVNTAGVRCDAAVVALDARSNIVTTNALDPNCTFSASLFDTQPPAGAGNIQGSPAFASIDPGNELADNYYRITAASAAIDNAVSTLAIDI